MPINFVLEFSATCLGPDLFQMVAQVPCIFCMVLHGNMVLPCCAGRKLRTGGQKHEQTAGNVMFRPISPSVVLPFLFFYISRVCNLQDGRLDS